MSSKSVTYYLNDDSNSVFYIIEVAKTYYCKLVVS